MPHHLRALQAEPEVSVEVFEEEAAGSDEATAKPEIPEDCWAFAPPWPPRARGALSCYFSGAVPFQAPGVSFTV